MVGLIARGMSGFVFQGRKFSLIEDDTKLKVGDVWVGHYPGRVVVLAEEDIEVGLSVAICSCCYYRETEARPTLTFVGSRRAGKTLQGMARARELMGEGFTVGRYPSWPDSRWSFIRRELLKVLDKQKKKVQSNHVTHHGRP